MNKEILRYNKIYEPLYKRGYHGNKKINMTHSESLIKKTEKIIPQPKGIKILDIGCANGTCVKMLQDLKYDAYGIDISETAVEMATNRGAKNCLLGSVTKIPFNDGYFDSITCSDVLEHIFEEDIPKAISEIYRVTSKYAFIKVSMAKEKNKSWINIYNSVSEEKLDNLHVSVLPLDFWKSHLLKTGFKILEIEMINKNCFEMILEKV